MKILFAITIVIMIGVTIIAQEKQILSNRLLSAIMNEDITFLSTIPEIKKQQIIIDKDYSYTPYEVAVINGKREVVKYLLTKGFDPNKDLVFRSYSLSWAVFRGDLEMIKILENAGAKYFKPNEYKYYLNVTPFSIAVSCGHVDIINYYLNKNIDINTGLPQGEKSEFLLISPISYAIGYKRHEIVKDLLKKNAVLTPNEGKIISPLHVAVCVRDEEIVKMLIEKGHDIEGYSKSTQLSPLQFCLDRFQVVDYNKISMGSITDSIPLILNIACNRFNQVQDFVRKDIVFTPIKIDVPKYNNNLMSIVKLLLKNGARYIIDNKYSILLNNASATGCIEIVKDIYTKGYNLNSCDDSSGMTAIHQAIQGGQIEILKFLISKGAYVDSQGYMTTTNTPLQFAAGQNNIEAIEILLNSGAKIDLPNYNFQTALFFAVTSKNIEATEYLIKKGAKVDKFCYDYTNFQIPEYTTTAIHKAIENDMYIQAKMMIEKIQDINLYDYDGKSLLYMAVFKNNIDLINYLIKKGADVNNLTRGTTQPLHAVNDIDTVKLLIEKNANPNMKDKNGNTLLHMVASNRDKIEILKYLLEHGANPNIQNANGETPLIISIYNKNIDAINLLLKYNASAEYITIRGESVLSLSISNDITDLSLKFLDKEKNINQTDINMNTLLHLAIKNSNINIFDLLIKKGIKVNTTNKDGNSPLHIAVMVNNYKKGTDEKLANIEIIKTLIRNNVNINLRNRDGYSPIFFAQTKELAELLIKNGADINVKSITGTPILHIAISQNNFDLVETLLENGVSPLCKDENGNTALFMSNSKMEIKALLMKYNHIEDKNWDSNQFKNKNELSYNLILEQYPNCLNTVDEKGRSIYFCAIDGNNSKLILDLKKQKISINHADNNGITPLIYAIQKGNFDVIKSILESGGDPNIPDNNGCFRYFIVFHQMKL